ncbi:hypothetical protein ACFL2T_05725 [Elusimicrobiota bacterium]
MGLLSLFGIGCEGTASALAREIMGEWMITVEDVEKSLGVKFAARDRERLAEVPWSEDALKEAADHYVLFPGYPTGLEEIRSEFGLGAGWNESNLYDFKEKVRPRWYLMSARDPRESGAGTFADHSRALRWGETFPCVPEVAYLIVLLYKLKDIMLFPDDVVRCQEKTASGYHAAVGWTSGGIHIAGWADWATMPETNGRMKFIRSRKPYR